MTGFYLTLLSDSSMATFPNNTQSSFTVRLDHPISIKKENWEVALVEMITPTQDEYLGWQQLFLFEIFQ